MKPATGENVFFNLFKAKNEGKLYYIVKIKTVLPILGKEKKYLKKLNLYFLFEDVFLFIRKVSAI